MDIGHFGVSYLQVLILFEQWAGHRRVGNGVGKRKDVTSGHLRDEGSNTGKRELFGSSVLKMTQSYRRETG